MRTRRLGRTDLIVSELGFGAFAIGGNRTGNSYGPTDDATSTAAIYRAVELGCTFFDTADVYGYGHSEVLLGQALRRIGNPDDVVVATKVGGNFDSGTTVVDFSPDHIRAGADASLRRLGRDTIDLYQLHNPSLDVIGRGEVFGVLDDLVRLGKVRHYGVSVHTAEEGIACLAHPEVSTLQLPYNLLALVDDDPPLTRLFEPAVRQQIGLIAREPLAAGILSGRHRPDTTYGPGDLRGHWPEGRRRLYVALADALSYIARPGTTMAQAALRFVLDEPAITTTIVGIKTPAQADENFAAAGLPGFDRLEATAAR